MDTTTHQVKPLTNDQVCEILSVSECVGVVEDLFKDLSEHGTRGVVIEGGGEPTIYRDFDAVLSLLEKFEISI